MKELHIGHNALKSLPESLGKLTKLTQFWLFYNEVEDLPFSINKLKNLRDLGLIGNPIPRKNYRRIYKAVRPSCRIDYSD